MGITRPPTAVSSFALTLALCAPGAAPAQSAAVGDDAVGDEALEQTAAETVAPAPVRRGWRFEPRIDGELIFSDNVRRENDRQASSGFVGAVAPGFELNRRSSRLDLEFDYELIGLLFDGSDADLRHRADGEATLELFSDRLFVDVEGSFSQIQFDVIRDLGADLISSPDSFTDVAAFRLSPYWVSRVGGYADFIGRYSHEQVRYDRGTPNTTADRVELGLANLDDGSRFEWRAQYSREQRRFDSQGDVSPIGVGQFLDDERREDLLFRGAYFLSDQWGVLTRLGYENNDLGGNFDDGENGFFWSLGAIWRPSRRIEASATYGPDDSEARLRYSPSRRTDLEIVRSDRGVGIDEGVTWSVSLDHRTRYSRWSAAFIENVAGGGLLELEDSPLFAGDDADDEAGVGVGVDIDGGADEFDVLGDSFDNLFGERSGRTLGLPLSSSNFRRQRVEAGVSFERARTRVTSTGYYETRDFESSTESDVTGLGIGAEVARRLGSRTLSTLSADWASVESDDSRERKLLTLEALLAHALSRDFDVGVSYSYTDSRAEGGAAAGDDFTENRLGALMRLKF